MKFAVIALMIQILAVAASADEHCLNLAELASILTRTDDLVVRELTTDVRFGFRKQTVPPRLRRNALARAFKIYEEPADRYFKKRLAVEQRGCKELRFRSPFGSPVRYSIDFFSPKRIVSRTSSDPKRRTEITYEQISSDAIRMIRRAWVLDDCGENQSPYPIEVQSIVAGVRGPKWPNVPS